jgi:2-oxo-3-hexenedioate decarboxylase
VKGLSILSINEIVDELFKAELNGQEVDKFVDRYPELNNHEIAYQIQDELIIRKQKHSNSRIIGRKLGLTSIAKQQMMGVHEPVYGMLLDDMLVDEQEEISLSSLIHPKIEPEIAFIIGEELTGPGVSAPEVLKATSYVMPALEVIDSRYRNFSFTLLDVIADNASSSKFVLGNRTRNIKGLDLGLTGMVFEKNGSIVSTSTGAAVMGHPARAVAWMVNKLGEKGISIQPGDVILSGAICESITVEPGDYIRASFDGLGSVSAKFKA